MSVNYKLQDEGGDDDDEKMVGINTMMMMRIVMGSLNNDDVKDTENANRLNRLRLGKQQLCSYTLFCTLHDYDVELLSFIFSGGRKQT